MIQKSETLNRLAPALSKVQAKLEGAKKDAQNPFLKNKYASLSSVWDACRESLAENGLSVVQSLSGEGDLSAGIVGITTMLLHESGEYLFDTLVMKAKENTPQGIGSTITYGRRYGLAAIVGITPEDDDANEGSGRGGSANTISKASAVERFEAKPPVSIAGKIVTPGKQ